MNKRIVSENGRKIALITSREVILNGPGAALDMFADIGYHDGCNRIAMNKEAIAEDFFRLSTGFAGEVLQKFVNYSTKLAVIGDFSSYTSKPLNDFIYECNKGSHIFFVPDERTALARLSEA